MPGFIRDFDDWPRGPLHVAVGVFDGVHVGHRAVIERLRDGARAAGARALAATFDPLPVRYFAKSDPPAALTAVAERADLLRRYGADDVVVFTFDDRLSTMPAREFVERVAGAGDVRRVVVGPDFRFGHGREGDVAMLRRLAPKLGFEVEVVEPLERGGSVVSSTRIRDLVRRGDLSGASDLLGRPYTARGQAEQADRRTR